MNTKEIQIIEISNNTNANVFLFHSAIDYKLRKHTIKAQYKEYCAGSKSKKISKLEMMQYIQNNGEFENIIFQKLETCKVNSIKEIRELLNKHSETLKQCGRIVCSITVPRTKSEKFKSYYEKNKDYHIEHVKASYKVNRDKVLNYK